MTTLKLVGHNGIVVGILGILTLVMIIWNIVDTSIYDENKRCNYQNEFAIIVAVGFIMFICVGTIEIIILVLMIVKSNHNF